MVFTEEDAQNDGLIKKEAGSTMAQVAGRTGGVLYSAFLDVCEDTGREPSIVLGDVLIRALNNENFSERILQTEVDTSVIEANDIREDDLELVQSLADKFGLNDEKSKSPLEELVEQRIQTQAGAGFGQFSRGDGGSSSNDREVEQVHRRLDRIEQMIQQEPEQQVEQTTTETTTEEKTDVDELFSGDDGSNEAEEVQKNDPVSTEYAQSGDE